MKRWIALLVALLVPFAAEGNDCGIQFALNEQLGPPRSTAATVSVMPYDASTGGGRLVACWATEANKDALALYFNDPASPPTGVSCGTIDAAWTAAERVDLAMSVLVENTHYFYKVLCDQPDPGNPGAIWGHRPIRDFRTLPAAGDDDDFMFTAEYDPHYGTHYVTATGLAGDVQAVTGKAYRDPGVENMESGIGFMAAAHGIFHANLGDYYQTDGQITTAAKKSHLYSPRRRSDSGLLDAFGFASWVPGQYLNPVPGYPTRDAAGCSDPQNLGACASWPRSIQQTAVDTDVLARAKWKIWKIHTLYNSIFGQSPLVFAWGNHDNPIYPPGLTNGGGCLGQFADDGSGTHVGIHMANAWGTINVNPGTISGMGPTAAECETVLASNVPPCNTLGHYYHFTAGLAEFWVINAFEESGGLGTAASTPWDLTREYPETAADWSLGVAQWNWLSRTVAASSAKWKFVLTHHALGGQDPWSSLNLASGDPCYFYARAALLATTGRFCDVNGNTVDDGAGEKDCSIDDNLADGFNESEDPRPAGWKATNGACTGVVPCIPTPYNNRTAAMAGPATMGQEAVQALLKANIDSSGTNFILLGHDHLTAGGCKFDTDGCTDIWYITGGQVTGDEVGDDAPPFPGANVVGGRWDQMWDFNGDTVADFRTDGAPYNTPVDSQALTIRKAGTQIRGFSKVYVSNEGVRFDWESVARDVFTSSLGSIVQSFYVGAQAADETDFDGATSSDKESKRAAGLPTLTGDFNCDYTTSPAPLEGTQSCQAVITTNATSLAKDAGWADQSGTACMDFLFHPQSDADTAGSFGMAGFRDDVALNTGQIRVLHQASVCLNASGDGCFQAATRNSGGATGAASNGWTNGTTYMVRGCYTGTAGVITSDGDDMQVFVDACDPDDDNCDGKLDASSTQVTVPTWGAGTFYTGLADGATPVQTDGYRFGSNISFDGTWIVDALGVCNGYNPGAFKCGDGFE